MLYTSLAHKAALPLVLAAATAIAATACGGGDGGSGRDATIWRALSFNMYMGFDRDVFAGEVDFGNQEELAAALQAAFDDFQKTDAAARIDGAAAEIAALEPDVVGLQEAVSLILTKGTPDPSDDAPLINYLGALLAAIDLHGGPDYQAFVAINNTFESTLTLFESQQPFRFEEANVILVHPDFSGTEVGALRYRTLLSIGNIPTDEGPRPYELVRGVQHVRAARNALTFELFNTHLEIAGEAGQAAPVQEAQAAELAQYVRSASAQAPGNPIVVLGDMNAVPGSTTHATLLAAGWLDTFAVAGTGSSATCCQQPDLTNETSLATARIDYVFSSANGASAPPELSRSLLAMVERTLRSDGQGRIWLSDHFGALAEYRLSR